MQLSASLAYSQKRHSKSACLAFAQHALYTDFIILKTKSLSLKVCDCPSPNCQPRILTIDHGAMSLYALDFHAS